MAQTDSFLRWRRGVGPCHLAPMLDTITVDNLTLLTAQPNAPTKKRPPILFIPGYFAGAWIFEDFVSFFAERGYRGFAVNLRGRGGSALGSGTLLGRVSIRDFVADAGECARWIIERHGTPI